MPSPDSNFVPPNAIPLARTGEEPLTTSSPIVDDRDPPVVNAEELGVIGYTTIGPDHKTWGALAISAGLAQFTLVLTPDALTRLSTDLPGMLRELANEVRRQRSGLVIGNPTILKGKQ